MSTKDYSTKQEKMIASYLGWNVVPASGARDFHPGDIRSDRWLGECKTHQVSGNKIIFRKDVWKKICEEAQSQFKIPALFVDDGSQKIENTWVIFPSHACIQKPFRSRKVQSFVKVNLTCTCKELEEIVLTTADIQVFNFDNKIVNVCLCNLIKFEEMFGG